MTDLFDSDHTLQALAFIRSNPAVFEAFCHRAFELKEQGDKHGGAKEIWEWMRRNKKIVTDDKKIKLNNNYTKTFAVLAMKRCPALKGFFQVREK